MVKNSVLVLLLAIVGCSGPSSNSVVTAPTAVRVPVEAPTPTSQASVLASVRPGNWRRFVIGNGTYFSRGTMALALRYGTTPMFPTPFPYLEVVASSPPHARAIDQMAAPVAGLAVVHSQSPDAIHRLDFTFVDGSTVRLLSDIRRVTLVSVFEPDCVACTRELPSLKRASVNLAERGGKAFVVTSSGKSGLKALEQTAGRALTVVGDTQHSIYGVMDVKYLPANYFSRATGVLDFIDVGRLSDRDYVTDLDSASQRR